MEGGRRKYPERVRDDVPADVKNGTSPDPSTWACLGNVERRLSTVNLHSDHDYVLRSSSPEFVLQFYLL